MIDIEHITHQYGQRVALDDVSLRCPTGQMLALLGPNGSGKSTLFRLLSTASPIQRGTIRIDGHDLAQERDRVRAMIGAAFQSPALDGQLTVLENLHCHAALFGIDSAEAHARVRELLERFGVSDRARDRVSVLSGGLRRRVELAKALLTRPRVLLLDEPSAGLDPDARRQLRELLRMLRDDGLTIALATHDTDEAELADQVAILNRGTLAGMGTPRELRARVGRTIVRVETDASPDARAGLPDLPGRLVSGDVVEYHLADPTALMAELLPRLGRSVRSIHAGPPSLAAAYFQLTGTLLETNN